MASKIEIEMALEGGSECFFLSQNSFGATMIKSNYANNGGCNGGAHGRLFLYLPVKVDHKLLSSVFQFIG